MITRFEWRGRLGAWTRRSDVAEAEGGRVPASEQAIELAQLAAVAADDKRADEVVVFDVSDQLSIIDVFVLCSADSERQVEAVVDAIHEKLAATGSKPVRTEGRRENRWVLLDYADVVIHVQHQEEREFYSLERLWADCPRIEVPQVVLSPGSSDPEADR